MRKHPNFQVLAKGLLVDLYRLIKCACLEIASLIGLSHRPTLLLATFAGSTSFEQEQPVSQSIDLMLAKLNLKLSAIQAL
jgi:hypothetical protein